MTSPSVSVMVPTYRRPADLRRCLAALDAQTLAPHEVLVVVRDDDAETWAALEGVRADGIARRVRTVTVSEPGVVAAMNAALAHVETDVVAITDDDAAPHPDWLERIVAHFAARPDAGGVGGRDLLHIGGVLQEGRAAVVGKIPAVGRHVGNHHLGFGPPRDVDLLKGVNGAYRMSAIGPVGFDRRLRGSGAQVYWEIGVGIALKRAGWKLVYDPQIAVDHFFSERFDEDGRFRFSPVAMENATYNEALLRMEHLSPAGRAAFMAWAEIVGTLAAPGLLQWPRFVCREGLVTATRKLIATFKGRAGAWLALLRA